MNKKEQLIERYKKDRDVAIAVVAIQKKLMTETLTLRFKLLFPEITEKDGEWDYFGVKFSFFTGKHSCFLISKETNNWVSTFPELAEIQMAIACYLEELYLSSDRETYRKENLALGDYRDYKASYSPNLPPV